MQRYKYVIGVVLFLLVTIIIYNITLPFPVRDGDIKEGYVDLVTHNLDKEGVMKLNGSWLFYHNAFVSYDEIISDDSAYVPELIYVPSDWNEQVINGAPVGSYAYGTYRLNIEVDPVSDKVLGLIVYDVLSAYQLFWNGELVAESGQISTDQEGAIGNILPKTIYIPVHQKDNTLTMYVSNYLQDAGGLWGEVYVGSAEDIHFMKLSSVALQMFFIGALLMMAFYHVVLFLLSRENKTSLVYGLFMLLLCMRELLVGERLFNHIFPGISFELRVSLEYITFYLSGMFFCAFLYYLYIDIFSKWIMKLIVTIMMTFTLITVFTPVSFFSKTLNIFQLIVIFISIYLLYVVVRGFSFENEGSDLILAGSIIVMAAVINDILYTERMIDTGYFVSAGVLFLAFCQSIVLAIINTKTHMQAIDYAKRNVVLTKMAKTDGLTGLYNHSTIYRALAEEVHHALTTQSSLTVAMLDIDYFKNVNDQYGHKVGDIVLKEVSDLIGACIRDDDVLGRYGGEEFMLILPRTTIDIAERVLERIRETVEAYPFNNGQVQITISIGAVSVTKNMPFTALVETADTMLYKAKNTGRNRVCTPLANKK